MIWPIGLGLGLGVNGGRWGLRNPEQLLAVIQGADALLAAGRPEAARALLAPFTGGGA